jgi:drug/metabolite transporter (DMT)-like permease
MQKLRVLFSFFVIYTVWGSTYLAILWGIASIPPFLLAGLRFFLAGMLLFFVLQRGAKRVSKKAFKVATITGILLIGLGNGMVTLAELKIASSTAALWIATVPIWVLLLNWKFFEKRQPHWLELAGGVLGVAGIALLPFATGGSAAVPFDGPNTFLLLVAAISWSVASLYQRSANLKESALQVSGVQMIMGGLFLLVLATLQGDWLKLWHSTVELRSLLAFVYLIFFGAILGFTSYSWLIKNVAPQKVTTYALVNPLIALLLGIFLAGEKVTPLTWLVAGLVIAGVALVLLGPTRVKKSKAKGKR